MNKDKSLQLEIEKQKIIEKSVNDMEKWRNDFNEELIKDTFMFCKYKNLTQQETDELINKTKKMQSKVNKEYHVDNYRKKLTESFAQFETQQKKIINEVIETTKKDLFKNQIIKTITQFILVFIICIMGYFVFFVQK